jgi:hypothetical protein
MPDERGHLSLVESGEFVLATYREIATHFHLSGPNAARTKTKRAGWTAEQTNHPADPLRIRVPRDAWSRATEAPPPKRPERPGLTAHQGASHPSDTPTPKRDERPGLIGRDVRSQALDTPYLRALEGHISTLREDVAAERAARITAEAQRDQALADLRTEREQRTVEVARIQTALDQALEDFRNERGRAERAEAGRDGERARADALRDRLEVLQAQLNQLEVEGAASDVQAAELTAQLKQARVEAQAAEALRQAYAARRGRGRWARLRAAWRGE